VIAFEDFLILVHNELGLKVSRDDAGMSLDQVQGWDSVHLLSLLTALENRTGQRIHLPDMLQAGTLVEIYDVAVRK
jgi:acyl carrier protein